MQNLSNKAAIHVRVPCEAGEFFEVSQEKRTMDYAYVVIEQMQSAVVIGYSS